MVEDSSILQKPKISVEVDHMYWCNRIALIFHSNSHIFVPFDIVSVEIDPGAAFEHVEVTSVCFVVAGL